MKKRCAISVTVEEHILEMIDKLCGGSQPSIGKMGGRNQWVRELIYRELGQGLALDPRAVKPLNPFTKKELDALVKSKNMTNGGVAEVVGLLWDRGYSYQQIAKALTDEDIATKRGGTWHRETIRQIVARKNKYTDKKVGN